MSVDRYSEPDIHCRGCLASAAPTRWPWPCSSCLHERPMHPYEVAQTLRHRAKHESIKLNYGSLYSVVDVARDARADRGDRRRCGRGGARSAPIYAITDDGRVEMTDWLSTSMLAMPANDYPQFEAAPVDGAPPCRPTDALGCLRERARNLVDRARAPATAPSPRPTRARACLGCFTLEAELPRGHARGRARPSWSASSRTSRAARLDGLRPLVEPGTGPTARSTPTPCGHRGAVRRAPPARRSDRRER